MYTQKKGINSFKKHKSRISWNFPSRKKKKEKKLFSIEFSITFNVLYIVFSHVLKTRYNGSLASQLLCSCFPTCRRQLRQPVIRCVTDGAAKKRLDFSRGHPIYRMNYRRDQKRDRTNENTKGNPWMSEVSIGRTVSSFIHLALRIRTLVPRIIDKNFYQWPRESFALSHGRTLGNMYPKRAINLTT